MNCYYRYHISVFFTKNLNDTADFIQAYAKRVEEFPGFQENIQITTDSYQEALIKSQRKSNVTNSTVFLAQLSAIPGISYKKAESFVQHHNLRCMNDLVCLLNDKEEKQAIKILTEAPGIGAKLAKEIIDKIMVGA
jgi:ERCC4-type nuclease